MDFMKWLNSLDEILFELVSWLVFFPVTVWAALVRPLAMMDYADRELARPLDERYAQAVSPPMFLALALATGHIVREALGEADAVVANTHGLSGMIADDRSALILRILLFALFPVVNATMLIVARRVPLERNALRAGFYAQCYPAGVLALGMAIGSAVGTSQWRAGEAIGWAVALPTIAWFLATQTRWYRARLGTGWLRALGRAITGMALPVALMFCVGLLLVQ